MSDDDLIAQLRSQLDRLTADYSAAAQTIVHLRHELGRADARGAATQAHAPQSFKAGMVAGLRVAALALTEAGFGWDDEAIAIVTAEIERVDQRFDAMAKLPDGDPDL